MWERLWGRWLTSGIWFIHGADSRWNTMGCPCCNFWCTELWSHLSCLTQLWSSWSRLRPQWSICSPFDRKPNCFGQEIQGQTENKNRDTVRAVNLTIVMTICATRTVHYQGLIGILNGIWLVSTSAWNVVNLQSWTKLPKPQPTRRMLPSPPPAFRLKWWLSKSTQWQIPVNKSLLCRRGGTWVCLHF